MRSRWMSESQLNFMNAKVRIASQLFSHNPVTRTEKRFETDPTLPIQARLSVAMLSNSLAFLALEKGDNFFGFNHRTNQTVLH